MMHLAGKTALVTGASRGIGRAVARRLAAAGALVAVHYGSNENAALEAVQLIEKDGGRAFPVRAELARPMTSTPCSPGWRRASPRGPGRHAWTSWSTTPPSTPAARSRPSPPRRSTG
ncbi:SDR family NAD(P)-dependent oxidoreductase [Nonomuraea sp. NPDC050227]|uniref:SDR family NAD(P)-dependent oxidoreductase n=1 Tax=Nonomuraea sp. NPDC050227 TaxID=3364360 RepID=UPI0037A83D69